MSCWYVTAATQSGLVCHFQAALLQSLTQCRFCLPPPCAPPPLPPLCSACDESAPVAKPGDSERTDKLLAAEAAVIAAGGCVVRLVGLYHGHRWGRQAANNCESARCW
jgi:hypothetical protein